MDAMHKDKERKESIRSDQTRQILYFTFPRLSEIIHGVILSLRL